MRFQDFKFHKERYLSQFVIPQDNEDNTYCWTMLLLLDKKYFIYCNSVNYSFKYKSSVKYVSIKELPRPICTFLVKKDNECYGTITQLIKETIFLNNNSVTFLFKRHEISWANQVSTQPNM